MQRSELGTKKKICVKQVQHPNIYIPLSTSQKNKSIDTHTHTHTNTSERRTIEPAKIGHTYTQTFFKNKIVPPQKEAARSRELEIDWTMLERWQREYF